MREILFRGKAINREQGYHKTSYSNGDWVYGLVEKPFYEEFPNLPAEMRNTDGISGIEVDYKTIGEWTGLTDRNGVKIFEGDIIKARYREHNYPNNWSVGYVVFENGTFKMKVTENNNAIKHTQYCGEKVLAFSIENNFIERYYKLEVIGNIYDNKDLLKEE